MTGGWIIAQLGARRHYAVPRILHAAGMLHRLYTDICALRGWPRIAGAIPTALQPGAIRRLAGRVPAGVPRAKVRAFTRFGWDYSRGRFAAGPGFGVSENWLRGGRRFCELVLQAGIDGADAVYVFNSAGLEVLRAARERGMLAVMDQTIAPRQIERELMERERARHAGWERQESDDPFLDEYCERERQEWSAADLILCGSPFVRDGIVACGGLPGRCVVVPYGVDDRFSPVDRAHDGPLRVLTVGAVGLRKGGPYVLEAAKRLGRGAAFRWVGPVGIEPGAQGDLRRHVELIGVVPRSSMPQQYAWADVLLLPSICEGSAGAVYEAMMSGLPVICTPNTGSVVRDGRDGFVVPAGDADAIVQRLTELDENRAMLREMAASAVQWGGSHDLSAYGTRLIGALKSAMQNKGGLAGPSQAACASA